MPFETLPGLRVTIPTRGTTDWDQVFKNSFATPISTHTHTGDPDGNLLVTGSYTANSINGPAIRLANDEFLRGRNNAGSADINMFKVNTSDEVDLGASGVVLRTQGELVAGTTALAQNGGLRFNSVQGEYEGRAAGVTVPLGGDVAWKIIDNDAAADGTIILKAGKRWINGIEEEETADVTTAAPSAGVDDTIRDLDASTGLVAAVGVTIRNHIYYDTVGDKYVTITNAATADKQKYDSLTRTIDTTQYAPVGSIDIAESGGAHTLSALVNYPIQSWDSFHQLLAADGWTNVPGASLSNGTNAGITSYRSRRVGNRIEIEGRIDFTGVGSGGTLGISPLPIPVGSSFDTGTGDRRTVGSAHHSTTGTAATSDVSTAIWDEATDEINFVAVGDILDGADFTASGAYVDFKASYEIDSSNGFNPIVTAATEFNSDTAAIVFKATAIVAADPVGTYNTFAYAISTNSFTINGTRPTQTDADMQSNGFIITARAFNAAGASTTPERFEIKIAIPETDMSLEVKAHDQADGSEAVDFDQIVESATVQLGTYMSYDRTTGILIFDAGLAQLATNTTRHAGVNIGVSSPTNETDARFRIKASATTPAVGLPQANSKVIVDTGNGHGSTDTRIRRFTNVTTVGTDITRASSAANGDTFTINGNGIYSIVYIDDANGTTAYEHGISLNSAELTTDIVLITSATRLAMQETNSDGGTVKTVTWVGRLSVNDVIRAHTDAAPDQTSIVVKLTLEKIVDF